MSHLYCIADGGREKHTLPTLVRHILEDHLGSRVAFDSTVGYWPRMHRGGVHLARKFLAKQFIDSGADAIVAVVDRDRRQPGRERAKLLDTRTTMRGEIPQLRFAVGEASPHFEAWLVGDAAAITIVLGCSDGEAIALLRCDSPKAVLSQVIQSRLAPGERELETLNRICDHVRIKVALAECSRDCGLREFAQEVRDEIAPHFRARAQMHTQ